MWKVLILDDIGCHITIGNFQELNVTVKGDTDDSVKVLPDSLTRLSVKEIQMNVIHRAAGQIFESDAVLAVVSNVAVVGF